MANPEYGLTTFGVDAMRLFIGSTSFYQTRGGVSFDQDAPIRYPEFDGVPPFVEDAGRIPRYASKMTLRSGVFTPTFWSQLHPGSTSDGSSGNNVITPIDARQFIGDTLADFRGVYRVSDNTWHAIVARRISLGPWTLAGEDNNEALFDLTVQFLSDPTDLSQPPYRIAAPYDHATYTYTNYFNA